MREICIKQTVSQSRKRKNLWIMETIHENGLVAKAEKKYSYYVSEQNPFQDPTQLKQWLDTHGQVAQKKDRHVSIKKCFDPERGVGQMIYRVIGSFYVVQDLHLFAVAFMHSIKFDMLDSKTLHFPSS